MGKERDAALRPPVARGPPDHVGAQDARRERPYWHGDREPGLANPPNLGFALWVGRAAAFVRSAVVGVEELRSRWSLAIRGAAAGLGL